VQANRISRWRWRLKRRASRSRISNSRNLQERAGNLHDAEPDDVIVANPSYVRTIVSVSE
jgi:hypothetical protein